MGAANQPWSGTLRARAAIRPSGLGLGGVAADALLRGLLDDRRHVDREVRGLADLEHLDRPAEAFEQRVVDRLVDEHPRGRRALLPGVVERRLHEAGHDLVEVGVGVDDHAVLAAHLGDHALDVLLLGRRLARGAHDLEADRLRAGERDRVHARVAHERGADVALARQQRQGVGRHAGLAQRPDEHERAAGRLLGGLQHDGVAGRQRRGGHPAAGSRPGSSTGRSRR